MPVQTIGRLVIDENGITQRRVLGIFGESFHLSWNDLTGWWVVDQHLQQRATGTEQVIGHVLGLECAGNLHLVTRSRGDEGFGRLLAIMRRRVPGKERPGAESPLARLGRARS